MLLKAISSARDILVEDLQKLSKAINQPIEMEEIASSVVFDFASDQDLADAEVPVQVSSKPLNVSEVPYNSRL